MDGITYEIYRYNDNEPEEYCSTLEQAIYFVNSHTYPMYIVKVTREIITEFGV